MTLIEHWINTTGFDYRMSRKTQGYYTLRMGPGPAPAPTRRRTVQKSLLARANSWPIFKRKCKKISQSQNTNHYFPFAVVEYPVAEILILTQTEPRVNWNKKMFYFCVKVYPLFFHYTFSEWKYSHLYIIVAKTEIVVEIYSLSIW